MGTNYYLVKESLSKCVACNHDPDKETLHIGKSSYGWCFSLHVIPEKSINSLEDWKIAWSKPDVKIIDEYDVTITTEQMLKIITTRGKGRWCPKEMIPRRHALDRNCISNESGSWDLILGEFS